MSCCLSCQLVKLKYTKQFFAEQVVQSDLAMMLRTCVWICSAFQNIAKNDIYDRSLINVCALKNSFELV